MLDAIAIERSLQDTRLHFSLHCHDEVDSTNEVVKALIAGGGPEGSAVTSIVQSGGYGRQGKLWASPEGGLYLSVLLRPLDHGVRPEELATLSLVVGLAVREALRAYDESGDISVKWPNDVLCSRGKLCGISLEAVCGAVCVGIGVNVFEPDQVVETVGAFKPAYIEHGSHPLREAAKGRDGILETIASQVLITLDRRYGLWLEQGFEAFIDEYNERAFLTGCTVDIVSMGGDSIAAGKVMRVDVHGNLVLVDSEGREHCASSGEAHVVL